MRALGLRLVRVEDQVRRDPAPSRWHYRWQRLMLTPSFRIALRLGLPVAAVAAVAAIWFAQEGNRAMLARHWQELRATVQQRPEFQVTGMQVSGASPALVAAVTAALRVGFPVSSWDLDLGAMQDTVAALSAVRDVRVGVGANGILEVVIAERRPVALWRHGEALRLIDEDGVMTGMIESRSDRADLPLIAGDGARGHIDEALALFAAAAPIASRLRGLVRMGERRWDMILDRDQRILLPENAPVPALERVLAWQAAEQILDRDVVAVDMRDAGRPTLRLSPTAMTILTNTRQTGGGL
ncbi:MAG: cell division protein FtsQ/DivIB [Rubellimicrobium sp.]|nr:cell division protein FtsQ/DivIB [Rubellimicrobium sp.]